MSARFLVVNGHPDPRPERFCHALCDAYENGAHMAGFETRRLEVGTLDFPFAGGNEHLARATDMLRWADKFAIVFPLWLGAPPPILSSLLGLATHQHDAPGHSAARAAHLVVTMEMPAFMQRSKFRQEASAFESKLPGVLAREATFIGSVATISGESRQQWLQAVRNFGLHGC